MEIWYSSIAADTIGADQKFSKFHGQYFNPIIITKTPKIIFHPRRWDILPDSNRATQYLQFDRWMLDGYMLDEDFVFLYHNLRDLGS